MSTTPALCAAAISTLIATNLAAQQTQDAGFGHVKRAFNVTDATGRGDNVLDGAGYLPPNPTNIFGAVHTSISAYTRSRIYVAGEGGQTGSPNPRIYILDIDGTFIRRPADPSRALGGTRIFDLANDGVATLMGGSDIGIVCFEGDRARRVTEVRAANGVQTIVNPIAGPGLGFGQNQLRVFRGVAFDPDGNGGNGSLFVGDFGFGTPILEIDLDGNVLNTYANDDGNGRQAWDCAGLALDPVTGNLWVNSGLTNANGQYFQLVELDRNNNFQPSGVTIETVRRSPFRGGLDSIRGGDPETQPSAYDLLCLNRVNGEDYLAIHRVHPTSLKHGVNEPRLEGRINSGPFVIGKDQDNPGDIGSLNAGDTFEFRINPGTSGAAGSGLCFLNVGRNALVDGETNLFGNPLRELRAQWLLSNPPSAAGLDFPCNIGTNTSVSLRIPQGVIRCFELLKVQALYIEPALLPVFPPVIATNELWANFFDEDDCNIVIEAIGTDTFNSGLREAPFFQVHHMGGPGISQLKFSFADSNNLETRANLYFDTNDSFGAQGGVQFLFNAGNGNFPICDGTYQGTDTATGLVYDGMNDLPAACNVLNGNTGYISTDGTNNSTGFAANKKELTFRFTNFTGGTAQTPVTFSFDCDTDNILGGTINGAQHAGLVIHVWLDTGEKLATQLRVDTQRPNRRSVGGL